MWYDDGTLMLSPLSPKQHAYQAGLSTETALHDGLRIEHSLTWEKYVLGCVLNIQGAFNNVPVKGMERAFASKNVDETTTNWLIFMFWTSKAFSTLGDCTVTINLRWGCPQGGVISSLC